MIQERETRSRAASFSGFTSIPARPGTTSAFSEVDVDGYVYIVPVLRKGGILFLKTISRSALERRTLIRASVRM